MEESGASFLSVEGLASRIKEKVDGLLLIDLRSFVNFNQCHLPSSVNVCVPNSLIKRKNFSLSNVESTISSPESRDKFKQRSGCEIVLYDGDCDKSKKGGPLSCLWQKLRDEGLASAVYYLQGETNSFSFLFFPF